MNKLIFSILIFIIIYVFTFSIKEGFSFYQHPLDEQRPCMCVYKFGKCAMKNPPGCVN